MFLLYIYLVALAIMIRSLFKQKDNFPKEFFRYTVYVKGDSIQLKEFRKKVRGLSTSNQILGISFDNVISCNLEFCSDLEAVDKQIKAWGGYSFDQGAKLVENCGVACIYDLEVSAMPSKVIDKLKKTYPKLEFRFEENSKIEL